MSVTVFPTPSTGGAAQTQKIDIITSTGTWTSPAGVTKVDILLVGGGGGGGGCATTNYCGGGGAGGGVLQQTLNISASTAYTITIGAGGSAGGNSDTSPGGVGTSTTFGSLATSRGGAGGWSSLATAPTLGSYSSTGGQGQVSPSRNAGSGGGAALLDFIIGSTITRYNRNLLDGLYNTQGTQGLAENAQYWPGNLGINGYGAGGGGGSNNTSATIRCVGGLNAGNGANDGVVASAATANFGGGGGGAAVGASAVFRAASAGGSGVCIIRYWS
jgi:hypothetical protein